MNASRFEWTCVERMDFGAFRPFFEAVPVDPYVAQGFRMKRLSRLMWSDGAWVLQPQKPLFQSRAYNPTHGGIHRTYPQVSSEALELPQMERLLSAFAETFPDARRREVILQFQRVRTLEGGGAGFPAVEGWHQDDVDGLAIALVDMKGCTGAVTGLRDLGGRQVFEKVLEPGDLVLVNDRRYLHYTSPIVPTDRAARGTRDVILLSLPE